MRSLLAVFTTAVWLAAQSPLVTTFAHDNGGTVGGAVYFDLESLSPAGVTIHGMDLNFGGPGGLTGSCDVYIKESGWSPVSAEWSLVATGAVASTNSAGTPTPVVLSAPLLLGPGCKVGVAIVNQGLAHAYTTATTLPTTYATAELELTVGGGSNTPFAGTVFQPRLANVQLSYSLGGRCPSYSSVTPFGHGCVAQYASFYEDFGAGPHDLDGQLLTGTPNGAGGYVVTTQPGAGFAVGAGAVDVNAPDDGVVDTATIGGTLGVFVGSNCWIATGSGNSAAFAPSMVELLANPARGFYSWTDLDPTAVGGGKVYYEEFGALAVVTYDGCYGWGTADPNYVQFTLDTASGAFTIEWAGIGAGNPEHMIVGYSPSGPSSDPGARDLSAVPFHSAVDDVDALLLTAAGNPAQRASAASFDVTTSSIPAGALSHLGLIGLAGPTLPLDTAGLPGCFLSVSIDAVAFSLLAPTATTFTWTALTIPPNVAGSLNGYQFYVQSVVFGSNANTFLGLGAVTSNGLQATIGDV